MLNCTVPVGTAVAGATGLTVAVYVPRVVPATTVVDVPAWVIVMLLLSLLLLWLVSPAYVAVALQPFAAVAAGRWSMPAGRRRDFVHPRTCNRVTNGASVWA